MLPSLFQLWCLVTIAGYIPASGGTELRPNNSTNCSFYETCIESIYQCGPLGISLGYAKPRCENLSVLQLSDSGCQDCIQSQVILDWALLSEECFQSELLDLAQSQNAKHLPDPPDCQRFETDALEILKVCYLETDEFCQLTDSVLEADLGVILDAIVINSYYKSAVTKQVREVVSSCHSAQSSSLANKIAPATERVFLCVSYTTHNGLTDDTLTEALAIKFNQSPSDFVIADYDPQLVATCQSTSDPDWQISSLDYFVVHWTLSKGAQKSALTECQAVEHLCLVDGEKYLTYFMLTSLTTSSCGNGLREAGESCDLFVYTGMTGYGCDANCHTISGHECTTKQLQQSSCSMTICGDGVRTSDEECDGGSELFVGCDPEFCTVEDGYHCDTPYNTTSHCSKFLSPSLIPTISTELEATTTSYTPPAPASTRASAGFSESTSNPLPSTEAKSATNTSHNQATPTPRILPTPASTQASDTFPE